MKKALLIGINYLDKPDLKLFGCVNDAMGMRNVLVDAYGYELKNVTVLRDDNTHAKTMPTRQNILSNIQTLMNESSKYSEIWIHYSGHGSVMRDTNGDEADGQDEVLVPCDYDKSGMIADDELRNILEGAKCRVFLTMDCCHSGTNWDIQFSFPIINNRIYRTVNNSHTLTNRNVYMFGGSRDDQSAYDYFNYEMRVPMGAFTIAMIDSLRARNHNVSLLQLYVDIHNYLGRNGFPQNVYLSSSNPLPFIQIQRSGGSNSNRSFSSSGSSSSSSANTSRNFSLFGRSKLQKLSNNEPTSTPVSVSTSSTNRFSVKSFF